MSVFALTVFYGSKVIVSYLVGKLILVRLAPKAAQYGIVVLLLGLVLYVLLRSIPTVGWVIEVIVVVFGLGAIWLAFRHRKEPAETSHPLSGDAESDEAVHILPEAVELAEAA